MRTTVTSPAIHDRMIDGVRDAAREAHAHYPQYDGYWDGPEWTLVRFCRDVTTKGGLRFAAGDVTIARIRPAWLGCRADITAYSLRGAINVAVDSADFQPLVAAH